LEISLGFHANAILFTREQLKLELLICQVSIVINLFDRNVGRRKCGEKKPGYYRIDIPNIGAALPAT
jgi:hypothetical protein